MASTDEATEPSVDEATTRAWIAAHYRLPPPADAGASSPAPAAAVDLTAGADFVVPPVRQSYTRRAPDDDAVPPHR